MVYMVYLACMLAHKIDICLEKSTFSTKKFYSVLLLCNRMYNRVSGYLSHFLSDFYVIAFIYIYLRCNAFSFETYIYMPRPQNV
jgi:hypothetical protein